MDSLTGVSVMLHAPDEIPSIMKTYTNIGLNTNAMISIKPQVTKLSVELHKMEPEMFVFYYYIIICIQKFLKFKTQLLL